MRQAARSDKSGTNSVNNKERRAERKLHARRTTPSPWEVRDLKSYAFYKNL
jgi:hypothetical protein